MTTENLYALLQELGFQKLVQRGFNLMALCPSRDHLESRPSWGISVVEPHLHGCFACHFTGTLFSLLIYLGFSQRKAEELAGKKAANFSTKNFTLGLTKTASNLIDSAKLGAYTLTSLGFSYLLDRGLSSATIKIADCLYDPKERRVIFPWRLKDHLVGVTGRSIEPKNPIKTLPYFETKKGQWLYLPSGIIEKKTLILCEGEISALKIYQAGFKNVAAVGFGTITQQQATLILDSLVPEIICFFDFDKTGDSLTRLAVEKLGLQLPIHRVNYYRLPAFSTSQRRNKLDPAELSEKQIRCLLTENLERNCSWPKISLALSNL
jgi:DNA primase